MENLDKQNLIERYLDGTLSPAEREAVETRMASEANFKAEVALHRQLQQEFEDPKKLELRNLMGDILRDTPAPPEVAQPNWLKLTGIAFILLLGAWAIWRMALPVPENTPAAPTQQDGQTPSNNQPNKEDSLSKPPKITSQGPIAMADKASFKPNPVFEARLGNGGIRSTDEEQVKLQSPVLGADFTALNGQVKINFKGIVLANDDQDEFPLQLNIYDNRNSDTPVTKFAPTISNRGEKLEKWDFSSKQTLRLPTGVYYFTLERKSDAELIFVGKFTVDKKLSGGR